jgi:SAM-dependent methyltransferase
MFAHKRVLDCGSLDINGNNRELFTACDYTGLDVGPGKGVDVICPTHEFDAALESFDVVLSTECFEHDMHYIESLRKIASLLRPSGLFFFSCASTGRAEHGTTRSLPQDSPLTVSMPEWSNYYKNLIEEDIRDAIDVDAIFSTYAFDYNPMACDLYFWGVKRPTT